MYADDYNPEGSVEHYKALEKLFDSCESKSELSGALMAALMDLTIPRQDLHVLHKRACIKKGWEP